MLALREVLIDALAIPSCGTYSIAPLQKQSLSRQTRPERARRIQTGSTI